MNSKIEAALLAATGLASKRNEDRQEYLKRVVKATSELQDAQWAALPQDAQGWFNGAADALNAKTPLADFPDLVAEVATEAVATRRPVAAAAAAAPATVEEKPVAGDTILLTDAKNNEVQGVVKEIDEKMVEIVDSANEEQIYKIASIKSMKVIKKAGATPVAAAAPTPAASGAVAPAKAADTKPVATRQPPKKPADGKPSVTQQMREMICANIGQPKDFIGAKLKEGGVEFRDSTLDIMYADTTKTIETLKALKVLA